MATERTYTLDGPTDFYFPFPVREPSQLTVSVQPGGVLPSADYEVIGYSATAQGVTVRYPNAPRDGQTSLIIGRRTELERVSDFPDDLSITARALNAEFNNIIQIVQDGVLSEYAGEWTTGTLYETLDIVTVPNEGIYAAASAHEAGATFADDLAAGLWTAVIEVADGFGTILDIAAEIDALAAIETELLAVEANEANINLVAGEISPTNNIASLGAITADLQTLAGIVSDVTAVANISTDVTAVAAINTAITTVANIAANVTSVANNETNINTVAGISADVTTVAGITAAVQAVANNVTDVNNFADKYQIAATEPTTRADGSALQEGDLWYNTTDNVLEYYNGTVFEVATASASNVGIDGTDLNTSATNVQQAVEAALTGRKNAIINGNFDIWQRGTSFSVSSSAITYAADRWSFNAGTGGVTANVTRQSFALGQADVPNNPKYFWRHEQTAGAGSAVIICRQKIESVLTNAGKTVTRTVYAKANAALTVTPKFTQNFGTGGTPSASVQVPVSDINLTTSWQKFDISTDLPSVSGKTLGTDGNDNLQFELLGPSGTTWVADIAQVQLEKGSVATDFEQRSIGEELALCKRYFERTNTEWLGAGVNDSSSLASGVLNYREKRVAPSFNTVGTNFTTLRSSPTFTSFDFLIPGLTSVRLRFNASGTPFTAGEGNVIRAANYESNYIEIDAEL